MSGPKIVILVLVAVAVVFAVTVGAGSWPGRDSKFDRNGAKFDPENTWLFRVLKNAFPSKSLDQKRIKSECFEDGVFTIPENQPECKVDILEGKASIRDLKLKLVEGKAKLNYEPSPKDENAQPIEKDLDTNDPFTLQIFKNGGKLTLTNKSAPPQPCRIEITKSKGRAS